MKDSVLKRTMFSKPMSKETRNSGIMAGFDDDMEEPEDTMAPMARTPQNPEILMNNLRGDFRSVDARYMELAQMVGEEAAMETPPEVLAMLQPQLAQPPAGAAQGPAGMPPEMGAMPPGGIGSLPQAEGMMPPGMEGAPPFPEGGASVAPPTPDGLPPMRAADGNFASQANRFNSMTFPLSRTYARPFDTPDTVRAYELESGNVPEAEMSEAEKEYLKAVRLQAGQPSQVKPKRSMDDILYTPSMSRIFELRSGTVPVEEITPQEQKYLRDYDMAMGFGGGSIRNIGSAVAKGPVGRFIADEAGLMGQYLRGKFGPTLSKVDEYLGNMLPPSFRTTPMKGADGRPITVQARESIVEGAGNLPVATGEGTKLVAGKTLEYGKRPLSEILKEQAARNPNVTKILGASAVTLPVVGGIQAYLAEKAKSRPLTAEEQRVLDQAAEIPGPAELTASQDTGFRAGVPPVPPEGEGALSEVPQFSPVPLIAGEDRGRVADTPDSTARFIADQLKKQAEVATGTRAERIKKGYTELEPTFREILGDNKNDIRTNALLLLADAGFKFAGTYKPTMAMALAEAVSGIPKGFASLIAQAKDRKIKISSAALQQSVDDVNAQDAAARAYQLANLKAEADLKKTLLKGDQELQKTLALEGGTIEEDGGMGWRTQKTKKGSFIGGYIDPKDPTVKSALESEFTLRPTDNPYIENRGKAPTTVETNTAERIKLGGTLRALDNSLQTLNNLKGTYAGAYSPGTWFSDKINNLFVPVSGGLIRPDVDVVDTSTRISTGMNSILKNLAAANDGGRVAVQEQEWARDTAKGITDPKAFFANKEIAAKQFNSMEAMLRNARQQVITQLGYEGNDYVMRTPNTGTQNDPFTIPSDPEEQRMMFTYLASTIGRLQDPKATVYIKLPDGRVDAFNPTQLRGLIQK